MVEVIFLGVGEAFDENFPNTSILIRHGTGTSPVNLLLDCGFTAPVNLWREESKPDALDAIWISHFHGDHTFGLPALFLRLWEEKRQKELTIIGQKGIETFTLNCFELAYSGFYERLNYPLKFIELEPGRPTKIFGHTFTTAENNHSVRDLALRIDLEGKSVFYSGDGRPTPESVAMAMGCHLIIHEAFGMNNEIPGHGTVTSAIDMAKKCAVLNLALVHIQRRIRGKVIAEIEKLKKMAYPVNVFVPEPGERFNL